MNFEEAIQAVEQIALSARGKNLAKAEKIVLQAAWKGMTYQEAAAKSSLREGYLKCRVAHHLFHLISHAYGEEIGKLSFRSFFEGQQSSPLSKQAPPTINPDLNAASRVLGGQLPDTSRFYGRSDELDSLWELVVQNQCVTLIGPPGIGKSALVTRLIQQIYSASPPEFEYVIWKSLYHVPPFEELAAEILNLVNPELKATITFQTNRAALIEFVRTRRCLIVLDGLENVLTGNRSLSEKPTFSESHADYGIFLQGMIKESHQSCLLLTSQEPPPDDKALEISGFLYRKLMLEALDDKSAAKILMHSGLKDKDSWKLLINTYQGNPLALKLVANRITEFFGGEVKAFFTEDQSSVMTDLFDEELHEWFGAEGRLTYLEKQVAVYLAETLTQGKQECLPTSKIMEDFKAIEPTVSYSSIMGALSALSVRSLVIKKPAKTGEAHFTLPAVVKRYGYKKRGTITSTAQPPIYQLLGTSM